MPLAIQSHLLSAGDITRMKKSLLSATDLMLLISLPLTATVVIFGKNIIKLFGITTLYAEIGARLFNILGYFYIVFEFAIFFKRYIEGIGKVRFNSANNTLSLLVRIVLSYILMVRFNNIGITYAEAISLFYILLMCAGMLVYLHKIDDKII